MLGTIVRSIFLISILAWYSGSVWRLIDGYFRDQFRNYLEEEYRKNPRMRQDVQSAGNRDSSISTVPLEATVAPLQKILEACQQTDSCPVEVVEPPLQLENGNDTQTVVGKGENETVDESTDKNAFLEIMESSLESKREELPYEGITDHQEIDTEKNCEVIGDGTTSATLTISPTSSTATENPQALKKLPRVGKKIVLTSETKKSKKKKVRTIVLTEEDFATAKTGKVNDDDFWEFEEDADEREAPRGILISELPFKPRADIGDLDRVTEDEYCPLNLDDETSCGEAITWP